MEHPDLAYEHRVVVFLDFLGFRDHIERTLSDPAYLKRIAHAIDTILEFTKAEAEDLSRQVTQFSDCVVISYAAVQRSAVFDLLMDTALLQVELAGQGFLVRGGITAGSLLHQSDKVFGPALVEAYRLENEVAEHPRVIVDDVLVEIARNHPAPHHDGETEAGYVIGFLQADEDGNSFIDYLSWDAVVAGIGIDSDDYPGYLSQIAIILARGLQSGSTKVLRKMLWLHARYDSAIRSFFEPPRPPEVLAQHGDYFEALSALPRFAAEVSSATLKVNASPK